MSIPLALLTVARRLRELPFRPLFGLFGAFILACGFTHFMEMVTFQTPVYRMSGAIKLLTAVVSWATVIALIPTLPRLFAYADAVRPPQGYVPPPREWSEVRVRDYMVAVLTGVLVVLFRAALDPLMGGDHLFVMPMLGVVFVAWQCGFGPAVVCLLVSMAGMIYFFVEPRNSFTVAAINDQLAVGLFLFCGFAASMLGEAQRAANRKADQALRDLRQASAQQAESEARLRAFIDYSPAAKFVKDQLGRYSLVNTAFLQRLNRSMDEVIGKTDAELYPIEQAEGYRKQDEIVRSSFEPKVWEDSFSQDGKPYTFLSSKFLLPDGTIGGISTDLTERKQMEESLKASEARFRLLADAMPQIVWVTTPDGQHEHFNSRWYEYTGLTAEESAGWGWTIPLHPEDRPRAEAEWVRATSEVGRYEIEYRFRGADGTYRWFLGRAVPVRDDAGQVVRWFGTCTDIDDRKRQATALEQSEATLRAFYDNSPLCMGVVELVPDGDIRHVYDNQATCRFFGVPQNGSAGRLASELGTAPDVLKLWREKYEESESRDRPVRFAHAVGTGRDARWLSASVCRLPGGTPDRPRFCYVAEDVTDARRAEAAVRESELRYRLVSNVANDAIWDWDLASNQVTWNEGVQKVFGYAAGQVDPDAGWWVRHIHEADRDRVARDIHAVIDGADDEWQSEYRFRRADGSFATVFDRGRVVREDGRAVRMVGSMLDLTERLAAEQALRASEERAAFVRQASGVGFWYCDLPFSTLEWDPLVKAHFHLPADAPVTIDTFYARIHPDDREPTRQAIARSIEHREGYDTVYRTVHPDTGELKWVRAIGRTGYAADGTPLRFDGVTLDVTAQRQAEAALRAGEEQLRLALQAGRMGSFVWFPDDERTDWSAELQELYGYPPGTFPGTYQAWAERVHPADRERAEAVSLSALEKGWMEGEWRVRLPDGTIRWLASRAQSRVSPDGRRAIIGVNWDVTERKLAEEAAREAADKFQQLADSIPQLAWMTDEAGNIFWYNRRWYEYTGGTYEQMQGWGWRAVHDPDELPRVVERFKAALASGEPWEDTFPLRRHDGAYRWFLSRARPIRGADGRIVRWFGTNTDVTEQRLLESQLREALSEFRQLTEGLPQLVWACTPAGEGDYLSRRWVEYTGRPADEQLPYGWLDHVHPDDRDSTFKAWRDAVAGLAEYDIEYRLRRADGEYRWFRVVAIPLTDAAGRVTRWVGTSIDIHERKRQEQELRASESRFRVLTETVPNLVWNADAGGRLSYVNRQWEEYTGVPVADVGDWWQLVHPDDAPRGEAEWRTALEAAPDQYTDELRLRRHDGEYRWFLLAAVPLRRADGTVDQWIGALADVDDQKREAERLERLVADRTADLREQVAERTRAEAAVRRQGEFLDAILDNITDGIVACDATGTLSRFNRATREFHGLPPEPLPPDRWADRFSLFRADGRTPLPAAEIPLTRAFAGERVRDAEMVIAPAGLPARSMVVNGQPLYDPDGRKLGAVVSMRDVTEEKRLRQREQAVTVELQRSNGELEKFAYVASHDLQEPLRKIQAFGDRLKLKNGDALSDQGRDYLDRMLSSAERMRTLINDLLAFSRVTSKAQPFATVDLSDVVRHVVSDLEFLLQSTGGRVEVGPLPTVTGDPTQLRQLFQNLIANGLKFHRPDLPPVVTVSAVGLGAVPADADPPPLPGSGWRFTVADNGIGFEQQYAGRIFELFQRLHGRGEYEGTGIGLAVCKKIVDRHGGAIAARGVPSAGATFVVDLPG